MKLPKDNSISPDKREAAPAPPISSIDPTSPLESGTAQASEAPSFPSKGALRSQTAHGRFAGKAKPFEMNDGAPLAPRTPVYALIDCNNFFVSCERVFRPDLWDRPVAVLSNNDGCIVARSNEVKALEVPMGVPYFQVRDILNQHKVTLFSGNFQLYGDFSQRVVQILQQFCPRLEVYSVDESFAEISSLPIDDYAEWAKTVRAAILQWTGIPVSIGVASTKTLAKAAAEYAKQHPGDGVLVIEEDTPQIAISGSWEAHSVGQSRPTALGPRGSQASRTKNSYLDRASLLRWLPVRDVWGIGRRTTPKLAQIGITTAYDLSQVTDKWAQANLTIRGVKTVNELRGLPWLTLEENDEPQKSIMRTRSFGHNVRNYHQLEGAVATFAAQAAAKLRQQKEIATGVMTYIRTSYHAQQRHGASMLVKLPQGSSDTGALIQAALQALEQIYDPDFGYRKAGVILLGLMPEHAWQLSFMGQEAGKVDRQADLMQAVDAINKKYNTRLVRHASENVNLQGWHSKRERRSPRYTTDWAELPKM